MDINRINPIQDRRWEQLLGVHPGASVFHTSAWLEALRRTYGYEPLVFTTSPFSALITNAIIFCRVESWLTGPRLISVPFADHCQPLFNSEKDRDRLAKCFPKIAEQEHCDYLELRLRDPDAMAAVSRGLTSSATFAHHILDLRPDLSTLFGRFHKSCFQRKIKRAERERVVYAAGRSDQILNQFYGLLVMTRRRHGVPPQPLAWFRNLRECFGEAFKIGVALLNDRPIASILTLKYKDAVVYKYGGSDAGSHSLGAMPYLFWQIIQEAKAEGGKELDLGRSDLDGVGLIAFKDHMGATRRSLHYYRHPAQFATPGVLSSLMRHSKISAHLPSLLFKAVGNLVYRHLG
jgi:hypothetical protein